MVKLIKRLYQAFKYSLQGLMTAIENEFSFRLEIFLAAILIPLAFFVGKTPVEKTLLIASLLLVFVVELLNSAIEVTLDRISKERHPLAGRAKDMGSAAVLMTTLMVIIIWGGVLWENG